MNEIELSFFDHLLFFLFGIIVPLLAVFQTQVDLKDIKFDSATKKQIYYSNGLFQWICVGLILALWWGKSRSFENFGFQWGTWSQLSISLLFLFVFLYLLDVWWELRNESKVAQTKIKWIEEVPILPATFEEFKHFIFVAFTAGICEEVIFRGFFIQYFLAINQNNILGNWLSVIIPGALFAFGHLYQGDKAVAKIIFMAIIFGWIYLLTKSLLLLMLIHFIVDIIGGFLAYKILARED